MSGAIVDNSTAKLTVVRAEVAPCRIKLEIEIPATIVTKTYERTLGLFNKNAKFKGFRPGKTPKSLLKKKYGAEIEGESLTDLVRTATREAVEQEKVEPETQPTVENEEALQLSLGDSFTFAVVFDVAPEFEVPEYKGVQLTKDVSEVEDSSVDEFIDTFLQQRAQFGVVERPAQADDLLKASYEADLSEADGEIPETAQFYIKAEDTWIGLREPELLPGCSASLAGIAAGEEREIEVVFPEEHGVEALAGKTLKYKVTVLEVHAAQAPEFNDEFAQGMGFEDTESMKGLIRTNLEQRKADEQREALRNQVRQAVMGGVNFALPPTLLKHGVAQALQRIQQQEQRSGADEEALTKRQDEFQEQAEETAERQLREHYVWQKIADAEEVSVEGAELQGLVAEFARSQKCTEKVMLRRLRDSGRLTDLMLNVRESKAIDRVVELAEITETKTEQE